MRFVTVTSGLLLVLAAPAEAQQSLTIYGDGRVLVRAAVPARVVSGASTHRLALGFLDPGSLFSLDPEVSITGASYDAAVDEANTMRRAVGRRLVFETGGMRNGVMDTVVAEVLSVEPELFRLADGMVTFQRPGRPRYPADLILLAPTVSLAVRSSAARPELRLGWFTDGGGWGASYQAVLGRGTARITGQATIRGGRLTATDAEVQLVAGNVGRAQPMFRRDARVAMQEMAVAAPGAPASEEGLGEVHLYTIPGRVTLRPGLETVASLFEPGTAPWERVYTVRGQLSWYGPLPQYGEQEEVPVEVQFVLRRPREGEFGGRPLPGGVWRIYEPDQAGRLQLVGEASAGHTAPGRDLRLTAGTAFDITAERVQTEYTTQREAQAGSVRTIANAAYRVTVNNAKDSAVVVDVVESRRGEWTLVESSVPAERLSSTETRFRLRVPARGQAVVTYRVRVVW